MIFANVHEEAIVVDSCDLSFRPAPSIDASRASIHRPSVDWRRPLQPSSVGVRLGKNHLQNGTEARQEFHGPEIALIERHGEYNDCRLAILKGWLVLTNGVRQLEGRSDRGEIAAALT
jgi:hypothetical protein